MTMAKRWLLKTEPGTYSWSDLVRDKRTMWDGVRNHQAANNLRAMQKGDLAFIYHSVSDKTVVGVAKVVRSAHRDPTAKEGDWVVVDVAPVTALPRPVTLAEIKADPRLKDMRLVRQGRLSVSSVSAAEWKEVERLARK